jgi:hypothetical protein
MGAIAMFPGDANAFHPCRKEQTKLYNDRAIEKIEKALVGYEVDVRIYNE